MSYESSLAQRKQGLKYEYNQPEKMENKKKRQKVEFW